MWDSLKAKIKSILEANTLIQEVYDWDKSQFKGTPIATVVPSESESSYETTVENERVYAFSVKLYISRGAQQSEETVEKAMTQLVDSVIDDFDKNWNLSGVNIPTGYTMLFVEAVPSTWGYEGREMNYRAAEIMLKIHINVDTTLIS